LINTIHASTFSHEAGGEAMAEVASGLEGVVVAETELSHVDGEAGELWIRGHRVEDLAGKRSFEEVAYLLFGAAGDPRRFGEARVRAFAAMGEVRPRSDGMDALREGVAASDAHGGSALDRAIELCAIVAVQAAAWQRARRGEPRVAPDPSLGHAADYLRMSTRARATPEAERALDRYLVTVVDHGMNASTFAARVVASTGSDDVSAVTAAIGALKGPLHGGAPGPVLDMLDAVGQPDRAAQWVAKELAEGRRIMGMGHRIYRVRDPRATVLEAGVEELERAGIAKGRLALARAVERTAEELLGAKRPDRPLKANVEFYTAVLLDAVGLDRTAFTPTFAVGRMAGWCAHVAEQRRTGRLIRPASRYVGPKPV
jgi:citrate synthase